MSLPPEKFRELVFQVLFSCHFLESVSDQDPSFFMRQLKTTRKNVLMAFERVDAILKHKRELDEQIKAVSTSYDISRIQSVELNILRLCFFEMLQPQALDAPILISEGVRLAKKFSTTQSIAFINAILEQLYKNKSSLVYNP